MAIHLLIIRAVIDNEDLQRRCTHILESPFGKNHSALMTPEPMYRLDQIIQIKGFTMSLLHSGQNSREHPSHPKNGL
jgi:hypothetical protein